MSSKPLGHFWAAWADNLDWKQLRILSITNLSLIEDFVSRWTGRLPSLRTLKLSAYSPFDSTRERIYYPTTASVPNFLATLQLECLSLEGFHRRVLLEALNSNGATLRKIQFHTRGKLREMRRLGESDRSTVRLITESLEIVRSACPNIDWFGLDVFVIMPTSENDFTAFHILTDSSEPSSTHPYNHGPNIVPLSSGVPQTPGLLHILDLLAGFRMLRDVRLSLYGYAPISDIISIFVYLRSRKQGTPLRSLLVHQKDRPSTLWTIWELGPEKAVLEHHCNRTHFREIWNTERMYVQKQETMDADAWEGDPHWGCPTGW